MQILPVAAAPDFDPNQPTLPGLEPDTLIWWVGDGRRHPVKPRKDAPVDAPAFGAYDDALRAANEIMVRDRRAARWGLFNRNAGRVDAIALVQGKDGIRLTRVDAHADPYKEPVPGQMFPGQNWWVGSPGRMQAAQPATLALIGAETQYDLRAGTVVAPAPLKLR